MNRGEFRASGVSDGCGVVGDAVEAAETGCVLDLPGGGVELGREGDLLVDVQAVVGVEPLDSVDETYEAGGRQGGAVPV
ncbi:hypothetical protein ACFVFF_07645 [Streptomyces sp. NPDC057680]|uniref:hypothetical protein n=1 Tax=Streptomyces sp. NPDC057680 TaxID=3346208 RepID=UPI0036C828B2